MSAWPSVCTTESTTTWHHQALVMLPRAAPSPTAMSTKSPVLAGELPVPKMGPRRYDWALPASWAKPPEAKTTPRRAPRRLVTDWCSLTTPTTASPSRTTSRTRCPQRKVTPAFSAAARSSTAKMLPGSWVAKSKSGGASGMRRCPNGARFSGTPAW